MEEAEMKVVLLDAAIQAVKREAGLHKSVAKVTVASIWKIFGITTTIHHNQGYAGYDEAQRFITEAVDWDDAGEELVKILAAMRKLTMQAHDSPVMS